MDLIKDWLNLKQAQSSLGYSLSFELARYRKKTHTSLPDGQVRAFKIVSMMELRASPGKFIHQAEEHKECFLIQKSGKDMAMLIPIIKAQP